MSNWNGSLIVSVRDYGHPAWSPFLRQLVDRLNDISVSIPAMPQFAYGRPGYRSCNQVTARRRKGITFCTHDDADMPEHPSTGNGLGGYAKANITSTDPGGEYITPALDIWWGHITVNHDRLPASTDLICHELVHVVTGERDGSRDQDSCMRGYLPSFGSWDVAAMQRKYA